MTPKDGDLWRMLAGLPPEPEGISADSWGLAILAVPSFMWSAFVAWKLYLWHVATLGAPLITYGDAAGIWLLVGLVKMRAKVGDPPREGKTVAMLSAAVAAAVLLGIGAVLR